MKKTLLVTFVGAFMLMQAPYTLSGDKAADAAAATQDKAAEPAAEATAEAAAEAAPAEPAADAVGEVVKVASLRGENALDNAAEDIAKKKQVKVSGGIKRSWELQPPSIPHDISKDTITLKGNTCMKCHSKANHEKEKAPVVSKSHYEDRDGKALDKPSPRRWFCSQCHTAQADVEPLVENTF